MTIPPFPLFASAAPSGATDYAHLRDADTDVADRARAFVRDAWARCSAYLDRDFARRFALEFHQRMWELRLCSTLLDLGWPLDSTCRGAGPDFLVPMCEGPRAWIEATATLHGDGRERVIEPPRHTGAILHDDEPGVISATPTHSHRSARTFSEPSTKAGSRQGTPWLSRLMDRRSAARHGRCPASRP